MNDRYELVVMGRKIGTCTGWDQVGDQCYCFYDYSSNVVGVPSGLFLFDWNSGIFEIIDDDGHVLLSGDFIEYFGQLPVVKR